MADFRQYEGIIRSAYDLGSVGIGVQRQLLDRLVQGKQLNQIEDGILTSDHNSNLLASLPHILDSLGTGGSVSNAGKILEHRVDSLRQKYNSLERQEKGICNIVLRSMVMEQLVEDDSELDDAEYGLLLLSIAKHSDKPKEGAKIDKPLTEEKSLLGFLRTLYIARVFPTEEYEARLFGYKKEERLRRRHIKYHADKLELMVEILSGCLESAEMDGYNIPPDYRPDALDSKWAQNWRENLGEEFPTITELINKSRKSIEAARIFLAQSN